MFDIIQNLFLMIELIQQLTISLLQFLDPVLILHIVLVHLEVVVVDLVVLLLKFKVMMGKLLVVLFQRFVVLGF
jgi:hypothetical protein